MIENDDSMTPAGGISAVSSASSSLSGDPALELFGNGWTPKGGLAGGADYAGRHRATDV
jgi:hypothetical protein